LVLIPALAWQKLAEELAAEQLVLRDDAGGEHPITVAGMRSQAEKRKLIEPDDVQRELEDLIRDYQKPDQDPTTDFNMGGA
jgi:hypothetical protein